MTPSTLCTPRKHTVKLRPTVSQAPHRLLCVSPNEPARFCTRSPRPSSLRTGVARRGAGSLRAEDVLVATASEPDSCTQPHPTKRRTATHPIATSAPAAHKRPCPPQRRPRPRERWERRDTPELVRQVGEDRDGSGSTKRSPRTPPAHGPVDAHALKRSWLGRAFAPAGSRAGLRPRASLRLAVFPRRLRWSQNLARAQTTRRGRPAR